MDSNTYWMIPGTSKTSLKLDPINGQIWTRAPRIYSFYYTKILQNILESIWEHPGQILSLEIWQSKFRKFSKLRVQHTFMFMLSFKWFFSISVLNYILRRWGLKMINFPLIKSRKAWIWFSYLRIWKFDFSIFLKDIAVICLVCFWIFVFYIYFLDI